MFIVSVVFVWFDLVGGVFGFKCNFIMNVIVDVLFVYMVVFFLFLYFVCFRFISMKFWMMLILIFICFWSKVCFVIINRVLELKLLVVVLGVM